VLQDVAGAAGAKGFLGQFRIPVHRQEDDLRVNPLHGLHLPQGLEQAPTRHVDIGDDDVGAKAPRGLDQLESVTRGPHDIVVPLNQGPECLDDDPVVADQK
jgi:hypothetical protein